MTPGHAVAAAMTAALLAGTVARAQPADLPIPAATTADYPAGVAVAHLGANSVYTGPGGRTLYGMDMRTLLREGADASKHCREACTAVWEPLLAPADAKPNIVFPMGFGDRNRQAAASRAAGAGAAAAPPAGDYVQNARAPDWTVIAGPQGPQWVYKGWHMVFVRKGDAPGSTAHEGDGDMVWNTLKYVPPVPRVTTPANVATAFVDGAYALVDGEGRLLFSGACAPDCSGWRPFAGGAASRGLGDWAVSRDTDRPQWVYRGKPVFVAESASPAELPSGAAVLRP